MMEAFGLPRPGPQEPVFTPAEARVLIALGRLDELWPADVRVQVGRAYGAMLSGIARAELQAFQMHTQRRLQDEGGPAEQLQALKSAVEELLPLADPLLTGVHRRWIEHELGQLAVRAAEQRTGGRDLPGTVQVTFLFCDLKDFTAYAQVNGDAAAIVAIEAFFDVVARERGDGGEFVKSLGDGAMLVYDEPAEAVAAGLRMIAGMRATDVPGVHASVHRGIAIARSGDYFGRSVNLAARLLTVAGCDELVATDEVVRACPDFPWEPTGVHAVRGHPDPVAVHRIVTRGA
jgi:adenylate cyclase